MPGTHLEWNQFWNWRLLSRRRRRLRCLYSNDWARSTWLRCAPVPKSSSTFSKAWLLRCPTWHSLSFMVSLWPGHKSQRSWSEHSLNTRIIWSFSTSETASCLVPSWIASLKLSSTSKSFTLWIFLLIWRKKRTEASSIICAMWSSASLS